MKKEPNISGTNTYKNADTDKRKEDFNKLIISLINESENKGI